MKETGIIMSGDHPLKCLDGTKTMTRRTWGLELINKAPNTWEYSYDPLTNQHRFYDRYYPDAPPEVVKCPYGGVGDRTWQIGMPPQDGYYLVQGLGEDVPIYLRRFLQKDYPNEEIEEGLLWGRDEHDDPEAIEIEGLSLETIKWKRPSDRLWMRETFYTGMQTPGMTTYITYISSGHVAELLVPVDFKPQKIGKHTSIHMPRWASRGLFEITALRVERLQEITPCDCVAEGIDTKLRGHDASIDLRQKFASLWDSLNAKRGYGWEANPWVWVITFKKL